VLRVASLLALAGLAACAAQPGDRVAASEPRMVAPVLTGADSTGHFLLAMGRRKFVAPLFETLTKQGAWGRPIAARIYERARPTYHAVTSGTVDKLIKGG
jgi:hypothetical protein